MKGKVIIVPDELGNVVRVSTNPMYGYIRVCQTILQDNGDGFFAHVHRYAVMNGKLDMLMSLNLTKDSTLDGKVVVKEQLQPTNPKDVLMNLKKAGKTDVVCRLKTMPIYRRLIYTSNLKALDVLIQHDNIQEIKDAYSKPAKSAYDEL